MKKPAKKKKPTIKGLKTEIRKLKLAHTREMRLANDYIVKLHRAEERIAKLESDHKMLSEHDEACHTLLDRIDGEPPDTTSAETLFERLSRRFNQQADLLSKL